MQNKTYKILFLLCYIHVNVKIKPVKMYIPDSFAIAFVDFWVVR